MVECCCCSESWWGYGGGAMYVCVDDAGSDMCWWGHDGVGGVAIMV